MLCRLSSRGDGISNEEGEDWIDDAVVFVVKGSADLDWASMGLAKPEMPISTRGLILTQQVQRVLPFSTTLYTTHTYSVRLPTYVCVLPGFRGMLC